MIQRNRSVNRKNSGNYSSRITKKKKKRERESRYQLQEKNCKYTHMEDKQCALNNQWVTEEIKEEIFKYLETNDMKTK